MKIFGSPWGLSKDVLLHAQKDLAAPEFGAGTRNLCLIDGLKNLGYHKIMLKEQAEILVASGIDRGFREIVVRFIHFLSDTGRKYGCNIRRQVTGNWYGFL